MRSDVWVFRTSEAQGGNRAPYTPSNPNPRHNSADVSIELNLQWIGGDPDNDIITYDVYFNGRLICNDIRQTSCNIEDLNYETRYSWRVLASDGQLSSMSPYWVFTTQEFVFENQAPNVNIMAPMEGEFISGVYNIRWNANDDGRITNTKIYYKVNNRIPLFRYLINLINEYRLLANINGNPENYQWNTQNINNGRYSLRIVVTDDENARGEDIIESFTKDELFRLNRLVSAFFDLAEIKAEGQEPMNMKDWVIELDKFSGNYGKGVLSNAGKISHDKATEKAEKEYRKYQVKTLSPVEEAYLDTVKRIQKKVEGKVKDEKIK